MSKKSISNLLFESFENLRSVTYFFYTNIMDFENELLNRVIKVQELFKLDQQNKWDRRTNRYRVLLNKRTRNLKSGRWNITGRREARERVFPAGGITSILYTLHVNQICRSDLSPAESKENEGTAAKWIRKLKIIAASDPLSFARQPQ